MNNEFGGVEVDGSWDDKVLVGWYLDDLGRHQVQDAVQDVSCCVFGVMPSSSLCTSFDAQDMLQEKQLRRFNQATLRAFEEHLALDATEPTRISDKWLFCEIFKNLLSLKYRKIIRSLKC